MKLSLRLKVMILVLTVVPFTSAFAASDSHKGNMNLSSPTQVAGKQLAAGDYVVKWNGDGPAAEVSIIRDGAVVATVPARVVKLDQKASDDIVEARKADNGDRTLTAIKFGGKSLCAGAWR